MHPNPVAVTFAHDSAPSPCGNADLLPSSIFSFHCQAGGHQGARPGDHAVAAYGHAGVAYEGDADAGYRALPYRPFAF
jgi:hypothetical protein